MNHLLIPSLRMLAWLPVFCGTGLALAQDNFLLHVPSDLIRLGEGEAVYQTFPVRETIAGSRVRGSGELLGVYDQRLTESYSGANWLVNFAGTSQSQTRATQRNVSVHQRGTLSFASQARVVYRFSGFQAEGFDVSGSLSTRTTSIRMPFGGLRRRIALRRVRQQSGTHRQIARRRGLNGIRSSFEESLTRQIAEVNREYQAAVVQPLRRNGIYPQRARVFSLGDSIRMGLYFGRQDSPELVVPEFMEYGEKFLELAVHESAINFTSHPLAGTTRSLGGTLTRMLAGGDAETAAGDLQISFAEKNPLQVSFEGDRLSLTLAGESFARGGQEYGGMEIVFAYAIEYGEGKQWLVLAGEPTVQHPLDDEGNRRKLGLRDLSLRRVLLNTLKRDSARANRRGAGGIANSYACVRATGAGESEQRQRLANGEGPTSRGSTDRG